MAAWLKLLPFWDVRFGHFVFCPIYFGLTFELIANKFW